MSKIHTYLLTKARKERRLSTRKIAGQISGRFGWAIATTAASILIILVMILGWQYSILTVDLPSIERIPTEINAQSAIFSRAVFPVICPL